MLHNRIDPADSNHQFLGCQSFHSPDFAAKSREKDNLKIGDRSLKVRSIQTSNQVIESIAYVCRRKTRPQKPCVLTILPKKTKLQNRSVETQSTTIHTYSLILCWKNILHQIYRQEGKNSGKPRFQSISELADQLLFKLIPFCISSDHVKQLCLYGKS